MELPGPELLVETLVAVAYFVLAVVLTGAGLALEYASVQSLGGGELTVAAWFGALGALLLYAGLYGVGYGKFVNHLRSN